jgi:hypothetical protein
VIVATTPGAAMLILGLSSNAAAGELSVVDGSKLNIPSGFANAGLVTLKGSGAMLVGGSVTNTGTIKGVGRLAGAVFNSGTIRAEGGELQLAGIGNTNAPGGSLQVGAGATLLYSQGLAGNAGTIALTGGAFDNNGQPLANTGTIAGSGTLRTGGLCNTGTVSFADTPTIILGPVENSSGGTIKVTNTIATFFNAVTNGAGATLKTTSATARFLADFTNAGTYISDPADNYFPSLHIIGEGALVGGAGDRFSLAGDLLNASKSPATWDTRDAELDFSGSPAHLLTTTAADRGASFGGYDANFAWGLLRLAAGESLTVADGDALPGAALYVTDLVLEGGAAQVSSLFTGGADVAVYYDQTRPANAYLLGQTYALSGGGSLIPVPEPAATGLIGAAAVGLLAQRRRRRISPR